MNASFKVRDKGTEVRINITLSELKSFLKDAQKALNSNTISYGKGIADIKNDNAIVLTVINE